jgi:D-alanine-D-alanine ligase
MNVAVLFGGPSAEHEVSCASALGVIRALADGGHRGIAVGITRDGEYRLVPDEVLDRLRGRSGVARAIDDALEVTGPAVELRRGAKLLSICAAEDPTAVLAECDVVFPALHGPFGEDGVLQGVLESLRVPYVGCGVTASAVGMNKIAMKRAFAAEGVPVTPWVWFDAHRWRSTEDPSALVAGLRWPVFVKPANMGSSIGITRVARPGELAAAVEEALRHDAYVLVEQGVTGREIECGVLGGWTPAASVVGEVAVAGGWFDYEQKYFGTADPMTVPAVLPDGVADRVRELALRSFAAIGGWGLARVDFFFDEAAGEVYVNELNTMPGFTAHSMYPKVWAASGIGYPELVSRLVELALER